jgi:hypothetical protein
VFRHNRFPIRWLIAGSLMALWWILMVSSPASGQASSSTNLAYTYHSTVPLGADKIRLQPGQRDIDLMVSAESSGFEGLERQDSSHKARLVNANGSPVFYYPVEVYFRVTASALDKLRDANPPLEVETTQDTNSFLLGLHLRVRVFQALNAYEIEPTNVELIGMPAYIPYDERIYRAAFHLNHVPSDARLVLEVFDSKLERIGRFHLELY